MGKINCEARDRVRNNVFGLLICIVAILTFIFLKNIYQSEKSTLSSQTSIVGPTKSTKITYSLPQKEKHSLFVPYWGLSYNAIQGNSYDRLIYFGIGVDQSGVDKNDKGYQNIGNFVSLAANSQEKYLTLRMVDSQTNFTILNDNKLQQEIIRSTVDLANKNHFDGVVLDLEVSSLPFKSIVEKMNSFVLQLQQQLSNNNLRFALLLFGDTFYRIRPYDVAALSQKVDEIMVMAYDFHKANSDPGPNFPLFGQKEYGYDFETMTSDFLNIIPANKLSIVFGLYGYDWTVDKSGKSIKQATSHSFLEMKKLFLDSCSFINCTVYRDSSQSAETKVTYTDANNKNHIVWFEDMESVAKKTQFLKEKVVTSFIFWAYSYF